MWCHLLLTLLFCVLCAAHDDLQKKSLEGGQKYRRHSGIVSQRQRRNAQFITLNQDFNLDEILKKAGFSNYTVNSAVQIQFEIQLDPSKSTQTVIDIPISIPLVPQRQTPTTTTTTTTTTTARPAPEPVRQEPLDESCGVSASSRLLGGEIVPRNEFRWAAALYKRINGFYKNFCGATIISPSSLLTAAHCVHDTFSKDLFVRVGVARLNEGSQASDLKVRKIAVHPNYNRNSQENDIALVVLERPLVFSDTVKQCCLPLADDELIEQSAVIIGWGSTSVGSPGSNDLRQITLPVWKNDDCNKKLPRPISKNMVCSGLPDRSDHAPCQGDFGGPLMVTTPTGQWTVAGVISSKYQCGLKGLPAVYTRVSEYADWLFENSE